MGTTRKAPPPEFLPWLETVSPTWVWRWRHLLHIQAYLQRVLDGELRRLMLFVPPRHGKSELTTVRFSAYNLELDPHFRVIIGAYNQQLALRFSRRSRQIARERLQLSTDRVAAEEWETAAGGGLRAVGVGTGVTGTGANGIVIDDPVKSREEAESERYRDRCYEWYTDDLYTRLEPGGWVILIMTRWHDDDLAGRILASEDGPSWTVVSLPAEAEPGDPIGRELGEALCPERYDLEALAERKRVLGRSYYALYQQTPRPAEGDYFKEHWFRRFDDPPERLTIYGASDYAVSDDELADCTEHGIFGVNKVGEIFVLDWWTGQKDPDKWIEAQCALIRKWRPLEWLGESGVIRRATEPFLRRRMRELRAFTSLEWYSSTQDKPARARPFQGVASMFMVYVRTGEWGDALIDQLCRFPTGRFDDKVDACSLIGMHLEELWGPGDPPLTPEQEAEKRREEREKASQPPTMDQLMAEHARQLAGRRERI